jgi:hypothetical protein
VKSLAHVQASKTAGRGTPGKRGAADGRSDGSRRNAAYGRNATVHGSDAAGGRDTV